MLSARERTAHAIVSQTFGTFVIATMLVSGAWAGDHTVTVSGSFRCYDGSRDTGSGDPTSPLAGARIEMLDSDCDGSTICDEKMGADHIRDDGSFSFTGRGGDTFSGPDVYLRVVYDDDAGVRLTDELNSDRWVDTPEHDHNNVGDVAIDFGPLEIGRDVGKGNASKCAVWHFGREAYREYQSIVGTNPPAGHYDIEYWSAIYAGTPWTNTDTTHWPIHYSTSSSKHEFAHTVRHAADGDSNHFTWDVTRFRYARSHSICDPNSNRIGTDTNEIGLAFGFNEGWAEYWEGRTRGCWAVTIDPQSEGNNAFALNGLSNLQGIGKKTMVAVLLNHPGQIHSLDDYIGFLAPIVAAKADALRKIISTVPRDAIPEAQRAYSPLAAQIAAVQKQLQEAGHGLQGERQRLVRARQRANSSLTCHGESCEVRFDEHITPAMIRMDIALRELAITRLRQSITNNYQQRLKRAMSTGTEMRLASEMQRSQRAQSLVIVRQGFNQAFRDVAPLVERSPDARPLADALRTRLKSLLSELSERRALPPGVAVNLMLAEDQVAPAAQH